MPTSSTNPIRCAVCGSNHVQTTITHHARRGATIYVFENVPAYVCDHCGEVWIDGQVLHHIDRLIMLIDAGKVAPAPVSDYGRLVPV
jgi:YgiT-type zinc finger domain-containing protein